MTSLTITLPMPPSLTNSGKGRSRHWWALNREKKAYFRQCDELQNVGLIPPPPRRAFGRTRVTVTMHLGARMDMDNAVARTKVCWDFLATRGYIQNDRLLEWAGMPSQVVRRNGDYKIVITLESLAEISASA